MNALDWRAVSTGFLLALAITAVGLFVGLPPVGLFGGTAAGSYVAARRAERHGAVQGAGVSVLLLVAAVVLLAVGRQTTPTVDSVNATSLAWAATVLLVGTAVGLVARR